MMANFFLFGIFFQVPLDLMVSSLAHATEKRSILIMLMLISTMHFPLVITCFLYLSFIQRRDLRSITKRYLTHLSDEELDKEL
jgi:hypothetical protein